MQLIHVSYLFSLWPLSLLARSVAAAVVTLDGDIVSVDSAHDVFVNGVEVLTGSHAPTLIANRLGDIGLATVLTSNLSASSTGNDNGVEPSGKDNTALISRSTTSNFSISPKGSSLTQSADGIDLVGILVTPTVQNTASTTGTASPVSTHHPRSARPAAKVKSANDGPDSGPTGARSSAFPTNRDLSTGASSPGTAPPASTDQPASAGSAATGTSIMEPADSSATSFTSPSSSTLARNDPSTNAGTSETSSIYASVSPLSSSELAPVAVIASSTTGNDGNLTTAVSPVESGAGVVVVPPPVIPVAIPGFGGGAPAPAGSGQKEPEHQQPENQASKMISLDQQSTAPVSQSQQSIVSSSLASFSQPFRVLHQLQEVPRPQIQQGLAPPLQVPRRVWQALRVAVQLAMFA